MSDRELQVALKALFEAIAARDPATVARLLGAQPELAHVASATGATREDPKSYFFEAVTHYAYEGDTALHLAAAAHVLAQRDTGRGGSGSPEAREQHALIVELLRAHPGTNR